MDRFRPGSIMLHGMGIDSESDCVDMISQKAWRGDGARKKRRTPFYKASTGPACLCRRLQQLSTSDTPQLGRQSRLTLYFQNKHPDSKSLCPPNHGSCRSALSGIVWQMGAAIFMGSSGWEVSDILANAVVFVFFTQHMHILSIFRHNCSPHVQEKNRDSRPSAQLLA